MPTSSIRHRAIGLAMLATAASPAFAGTEPFIGEIMWAGFNFAPRGYALCDGSVMPINQNTALFALLGTTYGGDGQTTFALPDMRGRVPMHFGQGPGLSPRVIGENAGAERVTLLVRNLPTHSHSATTTATLKASSAVANGVAPQDAVLANTGRNNTYSATTPNVDMAPGAIAATTTVGSAGESQPFDVMPPYLVVNCSIAMVGIFPSRS